MLTFEEKLAIIETYPELERVNVSLGRVNFQFNESVYDKKNVVYHLHPNGNGFVYAGRIPNYKTDDKGMVNIRDYSAEDLKQIIRDSITSLSAVEKPIAEAAIIGDLEEERWVNKENETLLLINEDETWNIYFGLNLEETFSTYEEAEVFLVEEGFRRA
ncbi:hypothetical protein E2K98_13810 [Bacillus salipaludis]|uniref:Uncharacterized protein n=1 Tax=Bacillus salipaludis TaxID=2547811 RepID=A0A4R5VR00_9BACI|nr:hypothetical protein [Bacillus salipaludis]MDQ6598657.1 hypothetical protein [Bacillus salipaludis]TDK60799.1 hypothetical protein E2K98_13810 [Bacillus salipaludis]